MTARSAFTLIFALVSAIMLGLAAGALWMVATLYMRQPMPWLALPIAALLSWAIRHGVRKPGAFAALLCALATALAAVYVSMLIAAAQIAGSMGLGLVDTIRTAGSGMLWQLARLGFSWPDLAWAAFAVVMAAWLGVRPLPPRKKVAL